MAHQTADSGGSMSELEELSQHVVSHPDDYVQRWRLAKKLYMAWEYTEAIKHLLILKKNWTRRLNVLRYLAATYYRLGRYAEAIAELKEVLQQWPAETAVWEQLARVYEIADQPEAAAQAWEHVLRLDQNHPIAGRAVARLRSTRPVTPRENLRLTDSDSGIHINRGIICPSCGAQNSAEFERCWQCHGVLQQSAIVDDEPVEEPHAPATHWGRTLLGGLATVAALSIAVHLTLGFLGKPQSAAPNLTVYEVFSSAFFIPRLVVTAVLLVAWPVGLWAGLRFSRSPRPSWMVLCGTGLCLACATYDLSWLPPQYVLFTPLALAILSLGAVATIQSLSMGSMLRTWFVQGGIALAALLIAIGSQTGFAPLVQMPQIAKTANEVDSDPESKVVVLGRTTVPKVWRITWQSTGSKWLDAQASAITFDVVAEQTGAAVGVGLQLNGESVYYADAPPYRFTIPVSPDVEYELAVKGTPDCTVNVTLYGLLRPRVAP